MDDTLLRYYEQELTYIRQMGAEFAHRYPKIAGRLLLEDDGSEDLHVERLIEAFAFIGARIHKRIDDDFPEIVQSLLNIIYPHYTAPIPSMVMVQFDPIRQNLTEAGYQIDRGTPLFSQPVAGSPCNFTTSMPVRMWPVSVERAGFKEPDYSRNDGALLVLEIELASYNNVPLAQLGWQELRFYLNGQAHHVFRLYELLMNNVLAVELEVVGEQGQARRVNLPPGSIQPAGFGEDEALLPFTNRSFPGYRLLQEYFCLPEKFLFVDIQGIRALAQLHAESSCTLRFFFNKNPEVRIVVDKNTFALNVTPAINLFQRLGEPIRVEYMKPEYQVIPDLRRRNATEVYSLDRVVSSNGSAEPVEFKPFYSIRHHLAEARGLKRQVFWHSQRRNSEAKDDHGTDVFLSFVDLGFLPSDPDTEILSVHLTCTNRDLPSKLPFGDASGDFHLESAAPVQTIRCLGKPSPSRRPALGGGLQWRLISHLSLNYLSIVEGGEEALREILKLYDFEDSPSTQQQISGIVAIQAQPVTRRLGLTICRGVRVLLELDETKFVGAGLYLFASVLERFLGQYVSVNSFSQLAICTSQRKEVLKEWPPRSGERVLL